MNTLPRNALDEPAADPIAWREVRRVGPLGVIFRILFWGWQILMALWGYHFVTGLAADTSLALVGYKDVVGLAGVLFVIGPVWMVGSVVFGILVMLTRGRVRLVPEYSV